AETETGTATKSSTDTATATGTATATATPGAVELESEAGVDNQDIELLTEMLRYYDEFSDQNENNMELQADTARANKRVGDAQFQLGNLAEAEAAYRRAQAVLEQVQQSDSFESSLVAQLAAIYNERGQIMQLSGLGHQARQMHQKSLSILQVSMVEEPDDLQLNLELLHTYNLMGFAVWGSYDDDLVPMPLLVAAGQSDFHAALAPLEELVVDEPLNSDYHLMLSRSYRDLTSVLLQRGEREEAASASQSAIDVLELLVAQYPSVARFQYDLVLACNDNDERLWGTEGFQEGRGRFQRAIELSQQLTENFPDIPGYAVQRALTRHRFAGHLQRGGELEEAELLLRLALTTLQRQVQRHAGNPGYRLVLSRVQGSLTIVLQSMGQHAEAISIADEAVRDFGQLDSDLKSDAERKLAREVLTQHQVRRDFSEEMLVD
ncbi:MAG: hypothetical protein N2C12_07105, partial [Planctomycetales bacterium]